MLPRASKKIVDKIEEQAGTFIAMARKKFGIELDYSEEALMLVDDLITIFFKKHREHFIRATVFLGSYLGETIRKNMGGKWLKDLSLAKIGKLKGFAHPMTRARKRLARGTDDSLVFYYRNLKITTCRDSEFAPDRGKLRAYREKLIEGEWDLILLTRMLDEQEPRYVREEAADLLGRLKSKRTRDSLAKAARNKETVYYAAIALQGTPVDKAYKSLVTQLKKTDNLAVKQQILLALGKIGETEAVDDIIEFLNDEDEIVSHYAALTLGDIGGEKVLDRVLAIMAGLKPGKREHAITVLEILADNRAVPALIEALFSRDEEIRESAARALQYIPDERSVKPLIYCLKDNNSRIRIYAAYALANIDHNETLPHIKKLLKDEVQNVRLHATHLVNWLKEGKRPEAKVI